MAVAFIYDPIFLEHDTGAGHPESPERLRAILRHMQPLEKTLLRLEPLRIPRGLLRSVHPEEHIETVEDACSNAYPLDPDTQTSHDSFEAALKAAGSGITAVDAVKAAEASHTFAAVRPPGHHATTHHSMGFCLFNNIAVAARYAQECGFEKVLIVDFDVHHGNGTQEIFYADPTVFYFSTHQYPAYPGSGAAHETGIGEGEGFTRNFPLAPMSGDEEIVPIYEEELADVAHSFQPDIVLVSAGYDLHRADPLASLNVTTEGVMQIVSAIMECCDAPKLFFLEGGYNTEVLGECVLKTLKVILSYDPSP